MATAPPKSRDPSPPQPVGKTMGYEEYIERQIAKTRQNVKWVDITGTLMTLAGGTLLYLLLVALVDHWVLRDGLGFWGRLIALIVLLGGAGAYAATMLFPLLLRRINPVYAAHAIEQNRPTLKNTLVNFLLLRSSREGVSQHVYQAVQQQAAARLSQVQVESAVDRSKLIRISIAVLAIVTICCLYTVVSPKNPLKTVRRVMLPWADIAAPTRVTIEEVTPGDTSTFHEGSVEIRARVRGVRDSDPVTIYYSTADGQLVEQPVPMQKPSGEFRHVALLPAGSGGLRQDVDYYVTAGDARSKLYHIQVRPAPTIAVDRVEYVYPKYTGLEPYVSKHGDLKAIEGTRATLHAVANQKIGAGWIDLDCKGTRNKRLTANEREATAKLLLKLAGGQTPEFTSYQIRFSNDEGHENPQPIRHSVDVVRDAAPEIKLVSPTEPQVEVPINGRLEWKVRARDPDFALSRVEVLAERVDRSGDLLVAEALLKEPKEGEFEASYVFEPAKLKLKVGDTIRYWAEARDNRQPEDDKPPEPNRSETEKLRIKIVAADKPQPRENDVARNDRQQQQNDPNHQPQKQDGNQPQSQKPQQGQPDGQRQKEQPGEGGERQQGDANQQKPEQGQGGEKGAAQPKEGQGGEKGEQSQPGEKGQDDKRIDPMANPGDAFDKINEHLKEKQKQQQQQSGQQKQQPGEKQPEQGDKQQQPQQGNNEGQKQQPKQPGEKPQDGQQQPQQGEKPQPGEKQPQPGEKQQENPQQGQGQQPQDGPKQPNQQPGQKPMPGQQGGGGENQPDASQQGGGENARQGEGQQSDGNQKGQQPGNAAQKPSGNGQAGNQKSGGEKPVPGQDPERPQDGQAEKPMPGDKPTSAEKGKVEEGAKSGDNATEPTKDQTRDAKGQGSEVKGAGDPKQKNERPPSQKEDTQGGDRDNEKGPGGAGQKGDDKPSPTPQEKNQNRGEKKQRSPDGQEQQGQQEQPKSPSGSPKQSDSQGGESGDRSGGGKAGGGQTASGVQGEGGPGNSTASDQGNKKAPGPGEGETGEKAGNKVQSDKPTGQADPQQRKGDGSTQRAGGSQAGGDKSKQAESQGPPSKPENQKGKPEGDGNSQSRGQGQPGGQQTTQKPSGANGDAQPQDGPRGPQQSPPEKSAGGEDPNLEYARKATDLALEQLKDQLAKQKPDQELLDKLKWTPEDLRKFVDHWDRMKRQAAQPGATGAAAKKKLDESLRGLGLTPRGAQLDRNSSLDDAQRGLRASRRTAPPPEYAEQVKAYKQQLNKGQPQK